MSLPAHVLERIPAELKKSGMLRLSDRSLALTTGRELAEGQGGDERERSLEPFEQRLQRGELTLGGVTEICVEGGAAFGTSVALRACEFAQEKARRLYGESTWCAFVDPTGSLYAPGVKASGVDLSRLLVVRPDEGSLSRVALRLVESKVFPVVVIDTMGLPGASLEISLGAWVRVVRRLSLALEGRESSVLLLTDKNARRSLPLPVAERVELSRSGTNELKVSVPKSPWGAGGGPRKVVFHGAFDREKQLAG